MEKILGWKTVNYADIQKYIEYLNVNNWELLESHDIVYDAVPTHLILYNNFKYSFEFYPKDLPNNLQFVNLFEFENFIISKQLIFITEDERKSN